MNDSISIGDLAAILTIGGVTIYVLGLVGLTIPIFRAFAEDLTTAWYAVSLMPRTVVAGEGVRIWVRIPLILMALLVIPILLPTIVYDLIPRIRSSIPGIPTAAATAPGVILTLVLTAIVVTIAFSISYLAHSQRRHLAYSQLRFDRNSFVFTVTLTAAGLGITELVFYIGTKNVLYETLLLFAGSFLIGVPWAILREPPLPRVRVMKHVGLIEGENSSPTEVQGHLVNHSDGFWHLFDDNSTELLSIPDAQVLEVRILGREQQHLAERPRKPDEDAEPGAEKAK